MERAAYQKLNAFPPALRALTYASVRTARRLLIAAQLLLAIAYALPLLTIPRQLLGSDFIIYYTGAAIVRDGKGRNLYDLNLQRTYQAELLAQEGSRSTFGLFPFINPPHAALILTPFAYLRPKSAAVAFLALNCLIAVWVLRRLWQVATNWSPYEQLLLLTTLLSTEVFWYGLGLGTMTVIVFACIVEYYLALRAGRDTRAALWLIAATLKPQLILLPALIPLALHRWRLIGVAISFGLVIGLSVSLVLGFHIWLDYLRLLGEVSKHGETYGAVSMLMSNLRMILYWTVPAQTVLPIVYLALLAGVGAVFWLWRSPREFGLRFALTMLIGLFFAPYLHYQDTLIVFLAAALIYDFIRSERPKFLFVFPVLVLAATLLPAALIFSRYNRPLGWVWPVPFIIILMVVSAIQLRRKEDASD